MNMTGVDGKEEMRKVCSTHINNEQVPKNERELISIRARAFMVVHKQWLLLHSFYTSSFRSNCEQTSLWSGHNSYRDLCSGRWNFPNFFHPSQHSLGSYSARIDFKMKSSLLHGLFNDSCDSRDGEKVERSKDKGGKVIFQGNRSWGWEGKSLPLFQLNFLWSSHHKQKCSPYIKSHGAISLELKFEKHCVWEPFWEWEERRISWD